jgi:hypothetical protein
MADAKIKAEGGGGELFCTRPQEGEESAANLARYVNDLESKIDYAKWKQSLVLKFNYMPMKRITEKIENERANYVRKIAEEEKVAARMLSGKEITVQLDLFRQFSLKLDQKMKEIQISISGERLKKDMLAKQVAEKRRRLKEIMRDNMETIKTTLINEGVTTKEDVISLVRSRSLKDRFNPTAYTVDTALPSARKSAKPTSQQSLRQRLSTAQLLYAECMERLVASIQAMKSSEDIQSGIYLDIMEKTEKKNYATESRYSRSKISDTLISKFGSNQTQQARNAKNRADFEMDWETFRELNWKQIMGIVLVKDKNGEKIRQLLRYK